LKIFLKLYATFQYFQPVSADKADKAENG